jgi:hypothetical protein
MEDLKIFKVAFGGNIYFVKADVFQINSDENRLEFLINEYEESKNKNTIIRSWQLATHVASFPLNKSAIVEIC